MHDLVIMERFQPADHLDEQAPDLRLSKLCLIILMFYYLLVQISIISIPHDDAERVVVFIDKYFFVGNDIWIFDTCQDTHFVDGVRPLFFAQEIDSDLLQGVVLTINFTLHMIDTRIGARA